MRVTRSSVTAALFSLLQGAYNWQTTNIRTQLGDDLPAFAQPAMFLVKPAEDWNYKTSYGIEKYTLQYYVLVLVRASGTPEDTSTETVLDNILDAIDQILIPTPACLYQTLGGLVYNCYVNGRVEIDPPVLHEQAAIWIPIQVVVGQ